MDYGRPFQFGYSLVPNASDHPELLQRFRPVFSQEGPFDNTYAALNLPVAFTGGLLAARDFLQGLYVHMGFHPAWKYRNVFELVISHGSVLETRDVSESMQKIRDKLVKSPLEAAADATQEQIEAWVAATFKLNYNF